MVFCSLLLPITLWESQWIFMYTENLALLVSLLLLMAERSLLVETIISLSLMSHLGFLLCSERNKMQYFCPLLWMGCPRPLKFYWYSKPWIFIGFISHPLEHMCLTKASSVLGTSCPSGQTRIMLVMWCSVGCPDVQISSDCITTEGRRANVGLGQNGKGIFLFFQFECKQFLIFFSDRVREEHLHFIKSMAT